MDEYDIESHPDLQDPEWQRRAMKTAREELRRRQRRTGRGRRLALTAVVLAVLAGGGFAFYRWGVATSDHYSGKSSQPAPSRAGTTTAPAPSDLPYWGAVDLSHPFDHTPAQNWGQGLAGLAVPQATQVGTFSEKQVSDALTQVLHAIDLAFLDPDVLSAHHTDRYLAGLAPSARDWLTPYLTGSDRSHALSYVTLLADGYHLLPVLPRMNGTLTSRAGRRGELVVHASFVVAYAFDPGNRTVSGPGDMEPFVRVEGDYTVRSAGEFTKNDSGLWPDGNHLYLTAAACRASDEGFLAPAFSERSVAVTSATPEPGEFDPNQPMPTQDTCH
ncbi:hypothetical protein ORV05_24325 [Amycolatopsis cynarae]|uniref:Uncharacterized protein n=1 Tax=Amycolatopsis cynarae TaxID=2995223 RepID=A0ABY7AWK3_9PSEU|nr:hypothetical protein [Amycolatopsis sp. HUAS 11-8]WAL64094.1 hypothetical protein ORV05_24325 [Amycolatopsis sp. HUAS 11-8]